jgi:hypothetical protein
MRLPVLELERGEILHAVAPDRKDFSVGLPARRSHALVLGAMAGGFGDLLACQAWPHLDETSLGSGILSNRGCGMLRCLSMFVGWLFE